MGRWGSRAGPSSADAVAVAVPRDAVPNEEIAETRLDTSCEAQRPAQPPVELRNATVESPPAGYGAHKGCLFPSASSRGGGDASAEAALPSGGAPTEKQRSSRWSRPAIPEASQADEVHAGRESHGAPAHSGSAAEDKRQRAQRRNERRCRVRAERRSQADGREGDADPDLVAVLWLRDDLRLDDNPALQAASHFRSVLCVFIHDTSDPSPWPLRGAAKWWKHQSLQDFAAHLGAIGGSLVIRAGPPTDVLLEICVSTGAAVVLWNRLCEPWYRDRDQEAQQALQSNGLEVRSFKAAVLWEPWEARPDERSYNRGFGSVGFYRSAVEELGDVEDPQPPVRRLPALPRDLREILVAGAVPLEALGYDLTAGHGFPADFRDHSWGSGEAAASKPGSLCGPGDWASAMRAFWQVGERAAQARLKEFLESVLAEGLYEQRERFRADRRWTAILSAHIRFGELSPRRCYHEAMRYAQQKVTTEKGPRPLNSTFARRFFWRDLAYWALWRFPTLPHESLRPHYETERWSGTARQLKLWQRGRTGFPLVDAAMRQLWKVGWMPNYLRHVCAQFLIEFLDVSWKRGFEWFDYTLVDSDVAINAFMWQNGGHSGLDQWNFVMHPVYAAKSCDPQGDYVRRWLPELRGLPAEYIHCPWEAPAGLLLGANVLFARTYAERVIEDLDVARRDHAREVLRVRRGHPEMVARGGNEWFEVQPGYWVTLITREDFRQDTDKSITRQTADDPRNARRRQLQDPLSLVLGDFVKRHDRLQDPGVL